MLTQTHLGHEFRERPKLSPSGQLIIHGAHPYSKPFTQAWSATFQRIIDSPHTAFGLATSPAQNIPPQ